MLTKISCKALKNKIKMVGTAGFEPATPCTPYMAIKASKALIYKANIPFLVCAKRAVLGLYESIAYMIVS